MVERWDCVFVERIKEGRIYLTNPQKFGFMSRTEKQKKSVPKECGSIKGSSNENKLLIVGAFATAFNRRLGLGNGLVIRRFESRTTMPGLQTVMQTRSSSLRCKGSTEWLMYISPEIDFYYIKEKINERFIGDKLSPEQTQQINDCIKSIEKIYK